MTRACTGPTSHLGEGLTAVAPGVWVTTGRAAVLEGKDYLAVVDPGDEAVGARTSPRGALADVLQLSEHTGKRVRWVLLTHGHPDHVANLAVFCDTLGPGIRVVAHPAGPVTPDIPVTEMRLLPVGPGIHAVPTPGHAADGDDLSFWIEPAGVLFSGDLVQPKGETWHEAFFPSPWVFFRDGEIYRRSLSAMLTLPFRTLVTGHREVRFAADARRWVELTLCTIDRVEAEVAAWAGPDDVLTAGEAIFRRLASERGIPPALVEQRLAPGSHGASPFSRFDLPGIEYFWQKRPVRHGAREVFDPIDRLSVSSNGDAGTSFRR